MDNEISTYQKYLINGRGQKIGVEEYLKKHAETLRIKAENKWIPKEYSLPLGMQFELSSNCNQRCIHCYNQSNDTTHNCVENELSIDEWKDIAHQVVELGIFGRNDRFGIFTGSIKDYYGSGFLYGKGCEK